MKKKANRLDAIKMIISSKDVSSQEELLQALSQEGFELTQATLSRDLKQLKVAKAANMNGKYVYVLPNNIMYKRSTDQSASEMLRDNRIRFTSIFRQHCRHPDPARIRQQHGLRHRQQRVSRHSGYHCRR